MGSSVVVPLEEYLRTSYRPDCEWVAGEVRGRNMGDGPHSAMQRFFLKFFFALEEEHGVLAYPELRTQVSATNYRIPDVLVQRNGDPFESIVTVPPLLCIEILSPDDLMSEMHEKIEDYLGWGGGDLVCRSSEADRDVRRCWGGAFDRCSGSSWNRDSRDGS